MQIRIRDVLALVPSHVANQYSNLKYFNLEGNFLRQKYIRGN